MRLTARARWPLRGEGPHATGCAATGWLIVARGRSEHAMYLLRRANRHHDEIGLVLQALGPEQWGVLVRRMTGKEPAAPEVVAWSTSSRLSAAPAPNAGLSGNTQSGRRVSSGVAASVAGLASPGTGPVPVPERPVLRAGSSGRGAPAATGRRSATHPCSVARAQSHPHRGAGPLPRTRSRCFGRHGSPARAGPTDGLL